MRPFLTRIPYTLVGRIVSGLNKQSSTCLVLHNTRWRGTTIVRIENDFRIATGIDFTNQTLSMLCKNDEPKHCRPVPRARRVLREDRLQVLANNTSLEL